MKRLFLLLAVAFLAGCSLLSDDAETPTATAPIGARPEVPPETAVPEGTPAQVVLTETPDAGLPPASSAITLTLWTNTEIAPRSELPGGAILLEQLNAFDHDHPEVSLFVELKTITDQGGSLSYLRTGRSVAPSILPDVILLPTGQIADAARSELIYPMGDLMSPELVDDLYPAARELATVDGELYAYPFALTGLKHIAYNQEGITETLPSTWTGLLAQGGERSLVFPAAGPAGAEWTLQLYLEAGGRLQNEAGQPVLDVEPLTVALEQLAQAVDSGLLLPQSGNTASVEQAWQIYQNSATNMVETTAANFLKQMATDDPPSSEFIPLPSPAGFLTPFVGGWAWAISTPDPSRQALAAELIATLSAEENLAAWGLESHILPARRAAMALWPEDDDYLSFLRQQLAVARPFPAGATNALLLALANATTDVILDLNSPAAAAEEAAAALTVP